MPYHPDKEQKTALKEKKLQLLQAMNAAYEAQIDPDFLYMRTCRFIFNGVFA